MKRIRKKISVYLPAAVVGLGCLPFTVYAQEEIGNNAGSFHVEGGTEGTDWVYEQSTNILTFNAPGDYTVTGRRHGNNGKDRRCRLLRHGQHHY